MIQQAISSKLSDSFTRLLSGLRINKALDDGVGLLVASLLMTGKRVVNVGIKNIDDGISYLNFAEGTLIDLRT